MKTGTEYVTSHEQVAEIIGCTRQALEKRMDDPSFPKKSARGWDANKIRAWALPRMRAAMQKMQAGPNSDLKRAKLEEEIRKLQLANDLFQGKLRSEEDHQRVIRELAVILKDTLAQFIGNVKVLTGDVKMVKDAERLRDTAYEAIRRRVEK
jgi:hypothetical protein